MVFGLLVALGFICGRETISLLPFGKMTVWKLVVVAGAISLLILLLTTGVANAIIVAGSGVVGLLYLWLRLKWLLNRACSVVHSERIHQLEL
jgi:hypothetical protein